MRAYATTDVGRVRRVNQDYIFCSMMPVGKVEDSSCRLEGVVSRKKQLIPKFMNALQQ